MFQNTRSSPSSQSFPAEPSTYTQLQPPADPLPPAQEENASPRAPSRTVRQRTSRACDQCNQLRTRCDGNLPCKHCLEANLMCRYVRQPKKRGKQSKKELAERDAMSRTTSAYQTPNATTPSVRNGLRQSLASRPTANAWDDPSLTVPRTTSEPVTAHQPDYKPLNTHQTGNSTSPMVPHYALDQVPEYTLVSQDARSRSTDIIAASHQSSRPLGPAAEHAHDMSYTYNDDTYGLGSQLNLPQDVNFLMEASSLLDFESAQRAQAPNAGSTTASQWQEPPLNPRSRLKYPVLLPLVPYIKNILPASLACELLEHYFSSLSSSYPRPASPYLLAFLFSRQSFLTTQTPRQCSPALLASMLWIATQTSDARLLTTPASARDRLSQKLFNLTISLLKPPLHGPGPGNYWPESEGNLRSSVSTSADILDANLSPTAIYGTLDDVATYIHIAIVSSAGESKGGSLRWWYTAWTLARELKLGQEVVSSDHADDFLEEETHSDHGIPKAHRHEGDPNYISEYEREERRRVWWLLYLVDRHLGLCYNRPLVLLDRECKGLLRPMDEQDWHSGKFEKGYRGSPYNPDISEHRLEFTGPDIFGNFLPLMTILGGLVDLQNARKHPVSQSPFFPPGWDAPIQQAIIHSIDLFEQSMRRFESQHLPTPESTQSDTDKMVDHHQVPLTETQIYLKTSIAYSTHILHVLHILATGKWDPISILEDEDNWISSPSFLTAVHHAVAGAEAVVSILYFDPELCFMPFLYGIYLLQGSFVLLLIADKLQADAIPNVVSACETLVRAHEACVVTLNTQYQRNFRKVMQSALSQAKGRAQADAAEQQKRRRDILALYRWDDEGTGLAT